MAPSPSKRGAASTDDVVNAAIRGGTVLMFVMTMQRAMNFVLNQLLLRYVDPAVFGMASIPLDLLLNTALFLSREGFRLALGRQTLVGIPSDREEFRRFVNLSWIPVILGPIISFLSLFMLPSDKSDATLRSAGLLFCLSAALESISEPAYLVCQGCLITSLRAYSEGIATLVRSALTFVLLAYILPSDSSLLAFGLAQVSYSLTHLAVYWGYIIYIRRQGAGGSSSLRLRSFRDMLPGPLSSSSVAAAPRTRSKAGAAATTATSSSWVDTSQLSLAAVLTGQSLFKHCLTQGDKIVLSLGSSHYSQGLYALAQNYGSLAARLFFQPLEESGRLMFSRLAAATTESVANGTTNKSPNPSIKKGNKKEKGDGGNIDATNSSEDTLGLMLGTLVKLVVLVGLIFACFGFNYTRVLLRILLPGKAWEAGDDESAGGSGGGAAAHVLSWYCIYVLLLALNGMTEAFVYAVAARYEVGNLSLSAALSFGVFAILTLPLMQHFGTVGLVVANSGGMLVRIAFSLHFIHAYFQKLGRPVPEMMPHIAVLSSFIAAFAGTMGSDLATDVNSWREVLAHVGFGIMALVSVVATIVFCEAEFIQALSVMIGLRRRGREIEKEE